MPTFSFTEKEWDKVRPSSIKKTGVSEAMREVLKGVPKDLKSLTAAKDCDKAIELVDELIKVFGSTDALVKKAKDDKQDAAGKLKTWSAEAQDSRKMLGLHKEKLIYAAQNKVAEQKMQRVLDDVEKSTKDAAQQAAKILQELKSNKEVDLNKEFKDQQTYRDALRSGRKAVTKKGFIQLVYQENDFHKTGLDPAKIEVPACVKTIETKLDALEKAADAMSEALAQAVENQAGIKGDGALADEARKLLEEYKASYKKLKALAAKGKQVEAQGKQVMTVLRSTKVTETNKMLSVVSKLHELASSYEDSVLKEGYRTRNSAGEISVKYQALKKKPGFDAVQKSFADWITTVFDTIRLCTMPASAVKTEVDEGIEFLIGLGGGTAAQAQSLANQIKEERTKMGKTYGAAVA